MFRETEFIQKAGTNPSDSDSLPPDIIEIVLKRICILCVFTAIMAMMGFLMASFFPKIVDSETIRNIDYSGIEMGFDIFTIVVSLGVAWMVQKRWFSNRTLVAIGLVFGIFVGLWLSIGECFGLVKHGFTPMASFSFNQVWVVFFPAIVPIRMRTTIVAVLSISLMAPAGRLLVEHLGWIELPADSLISLILFTLISAVMGLIVSRVVYKLGKSVKMARELGSYSLIERLGKGGMGEVWRANHKMLARPAAVKLIRSDAGGLGDQDGGITLLRRFENEAQATASLRSPHTIQIYDYGLSPEGVFFYVMELLEGINLDTLVSMHGPQPAERVIFLLKQACHSLKEAHESGLIHRDIKPANLFLCKYGSDYDFIKVLDFGLVKEHKQTTDAARLTRHGSIIGTPGFLPPELVLGKTDVDGRADLYALGCVAYWLLTGDLVFRAGSPMEMVIKHVKEIPEPPSRRTELTVPPELDRIVMSCLEKDPIERPRTATELADWLDSCAQSNPWTSLQAEKWWDLHYKNLRSS